MRAANPETSPPPPGLASPRALAPLAVCATLLLQACPVPQLVRQCPGGDPNRLVTGERIASLVLRARGGWQSSGVVVAHGEPIVILAGGRVIVGQDCSARIGGVCGQRSVGPAGLVRARIGRTGAPFLVGACWTGAAPATGEIWLEVEGRVGDGSFDVQINHGRELGS